MTTLDTLNHVDLITFHLQSIIINTVTVMKQL